MAKVAGANTLLTYDLDGTTYASVAQVADLSMSGMSAASVDVSTITEDHKTFIKGQTDQGELQVTLVFDPEDATQAGDALQDTPGDASIMAAMQLEAGSTNPNWRIEFNNSGGTNGTRWAFAGPVTGYEVTGMNADDKLTATVTIKISGDITYTASA